MSSVCGLSRGGTAAIKEDGDGFINGCHPHTNLPPPQARDKVRTHVFAIPIHGMVLSVSCRDLVWPGRSSAVRAQRFHPLFIDAKYSKVIQPAARERF